MKTVIIIPARFGSTRFPGKPLFEIRGKSMIQRVWENAKKVKEADEVFVATDSDKIKNHVEGFGGEVVMTPESCRNGTERCLAACEVLKITPRVILNMQGDAPLVDQSIVSPLVQVMQTGEHPLATPCVKMTGETLRAFMNSKQDHQAGGTTVTFDTRGRALYFSKAVIPYIKKPEEFEADGLPLYKHIGVYAYTFDTLQKLVSLPEGILERAETLEQLRALENGIPIQMVVIPELKRPLASVDSPQDVEAVESILDKYGE